MNWTAIEDCLCAAIKTLRMKDLDLLAIGANERSLTHRLAIYLEDEVNQKSKRKWHVDCEYNRDVKSQKELNLPIAQVRSDDLEATTVYPDIIVHRRKKQGRDNNLLVIEAKKSGPSRLDREKLIGFVSLEEKYQYKIGLFLGFNTNGLQRVILYEAEMDFRDSKTDKELQELILRSNA